MRLQFADLTFDADTRQVWSGEQEVRLSPKAFDLLALLIERRPRAVSKADIRSRLWPGTFVSDSSLPSLVSEIRDAIADDQRNPPLVRTVPRFGYAFQGDPIAPPVPEPAATGGGPYYRLIGTAGEVPLLPGDNVLGREGAGIIAVHSSTVSRRHARLVVDAQGAAIEDLGSKNGTYVNDRPLNAQVRLADGDQVRIGSLLFTFRVSAGTESTETQSSHSGTRPLHS